MSSRYSDDGEETALYDYLLIQIETNKGCEKI
jgi:hypothetical protein